MSESDVNAAVRPAPPVSSGAGPAPVGAVRTIATAAVPAAGERPAPALAPVPDHLRVGLLAPPALAIPPQDYGGTEHDIDELARGLAARGVEVVLFTVGTSTCPVERRWLFDEPVGAPVPSLTEIAHARAGYAALGDVDLIHDHTEVGPLLADAHPPGIPVAATVHGRCGPPLSDVLALADPRVDLIAISHDQRASAPALPFAAVIHHGVPVDRYPLGSGDGGYVLFLGRMDPGKGVHRAIRVARAAGRRLIIAAKMWERSERAYFREVVEPLLGPDSEYLGEVGFDRKIELLAGAEALLNPIRWREPFGLVMIEAMACGTPVLAFPEGAAPEIVEHAVTGYLCVDEDDMVRALVEGIPGLDREGCRQRCAVRFSTERVLDEHLELYAGMLRRGSGRNGARAVR